MLGGGGNNSWVSAPVRSILNQWQDSLLWKCHPVWHTTQAWEVWDGVLPNTMQTTMDKSESRNNTFIDPDLDWLTLLRTENAVELSDRRNIMCGCICVLWCPAASLAVRRMQAPLLS